MNILVCTDNTTAAAYIKKMGGTESSVLNKIALDIWNWCIAKNIMLTAKYIPGLDNAIADAESRYMRDKSDWQLLPAIFKKLDTLRGPLTLDLYASRWNHQVPLFYSWQAQPGSLGSDALQQTWRKAGNYAFPPFCLISKTLHKVLRDKIQAIIITPTWPTQVWYSQLLSHSSKLPVLLPKQCNLLLDAQGFPHPLLVQKEFQLTAWTVSGLQQEVMDFQKGLPQLSLKHTETTHNYLMAMPGKNGCAGVVNKRLVHFQDL